LAIETFQRAGCNATARANRPRSDEEVKELLDRYCAKAKEILSLHRDQLKEMTTELLARQTLDGAEFYKLVGKEMPRAKETVPPMPVSGPVAAAV